MLLELNGLGHGFHFCVVDSDSISKHTRRRHLDGIGPVRVAVAESVSEINNSLL